jgi:hypothetical protein
MGSHYEYVQGIYKTRYTHERANIYTKLGNYNG